MLEKVVSIQLGARWNSILGSCVKLTTEQGGEEMPSRAIVRAMALGLVAGLIPFGAAPASAQTIEDKYAEVARLVPEFGGYFIDHERDALVIYVKAKRADAEASIKNALVSTFSSADLAGMPLGNIEIRIGDYSWLELQQWMNVLRAKPIDGVYLQMIDKLTNRLVVGVRDPELEGARIRAELASRGIPNEAVRIDSGGPLAFESSTKPAASTVFTKLWLVGLSVLILGVAARTAVSRRRISTS